MSASQIKGKRSKTSYKNRHKKKSGHVGVKKPTQIIKYILWLLISGMIPQILIMQRTALFPHQKIEN